MTMFYPNHCYSKVCYRWDCTVHEGGRSTYGLNFNVVFYLLSLVLKQYA